MEAEFGQLTWRDIVSQAATFGGHRRQQLGYKPGELTLHSGNMVAFVQSGHQFRCVTCLVKRDERIAGEHRFQPLRWRAGPLAELGQLGQVRGQMLLVPCHQNGLCIGEILVESGPADTRALGDLGHGDGGQPVLGCQIPCRGDDRLAYRVAVRVDSLIPKLRHSSIIRNAPIVTLCFDTIQTVSIKCLV